jgi:hypothetical protein
MVSSNFSGAFSKQPLYNGVDLALHYFDLSKRLNPRYLQPVTLDAAT